MRNYILKMCSFLEILHLHTIGKYYFNILWSRKFYFTDLIKIFVLNI